MLPKLFQEKPKHAVLVDSGPIVALFNPSDKYHSRVKNFLKGFRQGLVSTWPVLTECLHLLSYSHKSQDALLEWIDRGALNLQDLTLDDLKYVRSRMKKYSDLPMDLADASLMALAEKEGYRKIMSIDADFQIYRTLQGKYLENLLI